MTRYDAAIIGSGQGGNPLAKDLAAAGQKVVMIEREHVGGTCINEGCTPTKTMVASARVAYLTRRANDYGVRQNGDLTVDMAIVRQRKRDIVDSFRGGSEKRLERSGVTLLSGEGRFTGTHTIEVKLNDGSTEQIEADKIFINTGASPAPLQIPGIENVPVLNSTTIMELDVVPRHLVVLGGGYIGLEFAQMFRRYGSRVTVVQRGKQLLPREDADIAQEVAKILEEDGIQVLLESKPLKVEGSADNLTLEVQTKDGTQTLDASHVLVAGGRNPNTPALNLSAAGVETDDKGFIKVNERLETNVPHIYAMGDVKGGPAFTHISYDDYRILRDSLLHGKSATITDRLVPYTVFIDPQLGCVGLNENEAKKVGRAYKVAKMPMSYVARALEMDETRGLMKVLVDPETSLILGCSILGIEGGEMMAVIQMAMMGKLPYTVLQEAVFAHPTLAESFNNLFAYLE
jgi:dihydrolipoamide dehydrogenase